MADSQAAREVNAAALLATRLHHLDEAAALKIVADCQAESPAAAKQVLRSYIGENATSELIEKAAAVLAELGSREIDAWTLQLLADPSSASFDAIQTESLPERTGPARRSTADGMRNPGATERFEKLKPHAKGGLGEVSVARDRELNREVALKEIQSRFSHDDTSRARFLLEAEVTGGLEHPGIVPVYGLGRHEDGRPYYAMRFIRGDSLKEAIDQFHSGDAPVSFQSVEFRQLLSRFLDVCNAIDYAHSRGVLHRDLKPGNIMLGKFGETLVVDWGLAKVGDDAEAAAGGESTLKPASGSMATQLGSTIGTPAFMPPEQATGNLELLGPQSDVYSLGATLYCLMTGKPPVRGKTLAEILHCVQNGEIDPPKSIHAATPVPLQAICLKALSLDPLDRYPSPSQLAADIERFLADEPVSASPDPLTVHARRWVRKHPAISSTVAAVVMVTLVGLTAFSAVIGRKNQQLSELNNDLDQRNEQLVAANDREVKLRELAQANERLAKEQSALAVLTLRQVLDDVQGGLRTTTGGTEIRRKILTTSLNSLDKIATDFIKQAAIDETTATAYLEMGESVLNFSSALENEDLSSLEVATKFFTQSRNAARERLDEPGFHRLFSAATEKLAEIQLTRGEVEQAIEQFEEVLKLREQLCEEQPGPEANRDLAVVLLNLGGAHGRNREFAEATRYLTRSFELRQEALAQTPGDKSAVHDLATCRQRLGSNYYEAGKNELAQTELEAARSLRLEALALDEHDVRFRRGAAITNLGLAQVYLRIGRANDAADLSGEARNVAQKLRESEPESIATQQLLQQSTAIHGQALRQLGKLNEAAIALKTALDLARRFGEANPDHQVWTDWRITGSLDYGDVLDWLSRKREALAVYDEALAQLETSAIDSPHRIHRLQIALLNNRAAVLKHHFGDHQDSIAKLEVAIDLSRRAIEEGEQSNEVQRLLGSSLGVLGLIYVNANQRDKARPLLEEYLAMTKRRSKDADDLVAQRDHGVALWQIAELHLGGADFPLAIDHLRQSIAVYERLLKVDSAIDVRYALVTRAKRLGEVLRATGKLPAALTAYSQAETQMRKVLESGAATVPQKRELAGIAEVVGQIHRDLKQTDEAVQLFAVAVDLRREIAHREDASSAWVQEFITSLDLLSQALIANNRAEGALVTSTERLQVTSEAVAKHSDEAILENELAVAHIKVGEAERTIENHGRAAQHFEHAAEILEKLEASGKLVPKAQGWRVQIEALRDRMIVLDLAEKSLDAMEKAPFPLRQQAVIERVKRQVRDKDITSADATLKRWSEWAPVEAEPLYLLACAHASVLKAAEETPGDSSPRSEAVVAALQRAVDAGWSDAEQLDKNPVWNPIRSFMAFKQLAAKLKKSGD